MPIPVRCACGKALNAPDSLAGKKAKCPGCGAVLSIPAAGVAPAAKPAAPAPRPAAAPAKPTPKPAASGTKAVPKPTSPAQAKTEVATPADGKDLHAYSSCPTCNSFVSKKDAICVQCGTHLVTGKQLSTVMSSEPTGPVKGVAILCLFLNLALPGLGTLIGGGKGMRQTGCVQLGFVLVAVALLVLGAREPYRGWLEMVPGGSAPLAGAAFAGGVIWALLTSLKILKNAKPAS